MRQPGIPVIDALFNPGGKWRVGARPSHAGRRPHRRRPQRWLAGAIYDYAGFYAAAFAAGIIANLANLAIIGALAFRQSRFRAMVLAS